MRTYWTERGVTPRWQLLLVYVLIVAAGAIGFHQTQEQGERTQRLSDRTIGALCALRHDLEDRVRNGERFLAEHPQGIAGIPAATLRQSIEGQRRTVKALSRLDCQSPK